MFAWLWFLFAGALAIVVFLQMALGHYGDDLQTGFSWLLSSMLPSLSLIAGGFAYAGRAEKASNLVERSSFRLSYCISLFYLVLLSATLLAQPFAAPAGRASDFLKTSTFWLTPVQGLATAFLGWFFVKVRTAKNGDGAVNVPGEGDST